ncbi:MAG: hypothetical protein GY839_12705 [candidate division Zixibacteria bacterium]|nr:hypothetical protein [candidate division Zixibacteria bacterium]
MKLNNKIILSIPLVLMLAGYCFAGTGSGEFKIGWIANDVEGNESVNHSTYNVHDGFNLSLERFRYNFDNGLRARADLRQISLKNRNLSAGITKSGLFGINLHNHQFRQFYDFDGDSYTRRNKAGADLWVTPIQYIKLFLGGSLIDFSGKTENFLEADIPAAPEDRDYTQTDFKFGTRVLHEGRMIRAEYRSAKYKDDTDASRDQDRRDFRLSAITPVPEYDWIVLSGLYRSFSTEYTDTKFGINSTTASSGARVSLPNNFTVSYKIWFNRAGSDSNLVDTDNLVNSIYITHTWPGNAGITAGYQNDQNDDFDDQLKANSYFFSGWLKPIPALEFKGKLGIRSEEINDGARLIGDEDRTRFKISGKYRHRDKCAMSFYVESKNRKNDQIGSETEFIRFGPNMTGKCKDFVFCTWGYSYSKGKFTNSEQEFEFQDHNIHIDMDVPDYKKASAGIGFHYYRGKRDLNTESFRLRFKGGYKVLDDYRLEAVYTVHNFDDLLVTDRYYTSNIVEISLIRKLAF